MIGHQHISMYLAPSLLSDFVDCILDGLGNSGVLQPDRAETSPIKFLIEAQKLLPLLQLIVPVQLLHENRRQGSMQTPGEEQAPSFWEPMRQIALVVDHRQDAVQFHISVMFIVYYTTRSWERKVCGVRPVTRRNSRVKWLWSEKPVSRLISAS